MNITEYHPHGSATDGLRSLRPFSRLDDVVKVSVQNAIDAITTSTSSPDSLLPDIVSVFDGNHEASSFGDNITTTTILHSVLRNATTNATTTTTVGRNELMEEAGREFSAVLVHAIMCNRLIELDGYSPTTAGICGMMLFIGIIYIIVGYRCFKLTMFLTGFLLGTTLVYLICSEENALGMWGNAGVALGSGLLLGLITMLVDYVGLFIIGLSLGVMTAIGTLIGMYMGAVIPSSMWTAIGIMFGQALLFALLTLWQSKLFTILASSALGAALLAAVLDYFIEKWRLSLWVADRVRLVRPSPNATLVVMSAFYSPTTRFFSPTTTTAVSANSNALHADDDTLWLQAAADQQPNNGQRAGELFGIGDGGEAFVHPSLCWYSWLILLSWPAFALIGVLTQWLLTANDYYYYTDHSRHQKLYTHRQQQAAARRRRGTSTSTTTSDNATPQRCGRRARRASTSSVCYVSVEEDNGWHYRHAANAAPDAHNRRAHNNNNGAASATTASSTSPVSLVSNIREGEGGTEFLRNIRANRGSVLDDIESAQSTPFDSPVKKTSSSSNTHTTTITTALTTARLLAIGAEQVLRKAGSGNHHHQHHHQAVDCNSLRSGAPLRDSIKYKQMYRARRANGDIILKENVDHTPTFTITEQHRHGATPTTTNMPHHQHNPHDNAPHFCSTTTSSPPSSSSVNSTWSASSHDQLVCGSAASQPHSNNNNHNSVCRQPTINSSASTHSAMTGLSTLQSTLPPPAVNGSLALYANSTTALVQQQQHGLPANVQYNGADSSAHLPTSVQQVAPSKPSSKKTGKNAKSYRQQQQQPIVLQPDTNRALQRLANSAVVANEIVGGNNNAAPAGKSKKKKKSGATRRVAGQNSAQGPTQSSSSNVRRGSLESGTHVIEVNSNGIEMHVPHDTKSKMM